VYERITVRHPHRLQLQAARPVGVEAAGSCGRLVRHRDRFAEMGERLLERRTAQGLIARFAPPCDCQLAETGLGEMMGDDFRLGRGALGLIAQEFSGAAVQPAGGS
jgi:hypothetical protein